MKSTLPPLGKARPPYIAALMLALVIGAGIGAERLGLIALPGPSQELVASVLPGGVVALTNSQREQNNLPALSANPLLTRAAQMKADDMAAKSYYAHVSPDGTIPPAWLTAVGYKYQMMGENLVIDRESSDDVVSAWMGSEAHRENILNPGFTEIGIGVANGSYKGRDTIYVVEMLAKPYPSQAAAPAAKKIATIAIPAPEPKPVSIPAKNPVPPLPTPVKTAATTTIVVRAAPEPKPAIKDTIAPLLQSIVASDTLQQVPSVVASSTYIQPALGISTSIPVVELSSATKTAPVPAPHASLGTKLHALASAIALELKSFFSF